MPSLWMTIALAITRLRDNLCPATGWTTAENFVKRLAIFSLVTLNYRGKYCEIFPLHCQLQIQKSRFRPGRVVCPNFDTPALTSSFQVCAFCRCCRHATKITNHFSKAETVLKLTIHNCCKTIFHLQKFIFWK